MPPNLLPIASYLLFTHLLGFAFLLWRHPQLVKTHHLLTIISLSWALGNLWLILALYLLALSGHLNIISPSSFYLASVLVVILTGYLVKRRRFSPPSHYQWLLPLLLLAFFFPLIRHSLAAPLDAWDSVAIWMFKAKSFFFSSGLNDNLLYQSRHFDYAHLDYPLGLPLLASAYYRLTGSVNDQSIQLYLLFFYLNSIFLFLGFLSENFSRLSVFTRLLITLAFFLIPNFALYSHNGYADIPLGFFISVALVCFINFPPSLTLIVALAPSLIKNEGLPFLMILILNILIFQRSALRRLKLSDFFPLALGLLAIGGWQHYKSTHHLISEYTPNLPLAFSSARLSTIANFFLLELLDTSRYGLALIVAIFALIFQLGQLINKKLFSPLIPLAILTLQLATYIFIFLITPYPLEWQLGSSLSRLSLHLLPALYIVICHQALSLGTNHITSPVTIIPPKTRANVDAN